MSNKTCEKHPQANGDFVTCSLIKRFKMKFWSSCYFVFFSIALFAHVWISASQHCDTRIVVVNLTVTSSHRKKNRVENDKDWTNLFEKIIFRKKLPTSHSFISSFVYAFFLIWDKIEKPYTRHSDLASVFETTLRIWTCI